MRRILVTLLLVMLPLQFSWAAVAAYCEHVGAHAGGLAGDRADRQDAAAGATHLGHHAHPNHGSDRLQADQPAAGDQVAGAADLDCGHCHGHCCASLPSLAQGWQRGLSAARPGAPITEAVGAHAPARPERPQWVALA